MTDKSPSKAKSKPTPASIEVELDAWDRFTAAVGKVVKAPPMPHKVSPESKPNKSRK